MAVLSHLMEEPCYDQLRTKEQLGYMVWSGLSGTYGIKSLWFVIQSTDRGPAYLENRVENFLELFYTEKLKTMDAETFASNVRFFVFPFFIFFVFVTDSFFLPPSHRYKRAY